MKTREAKLLNRILSTVKRGDVLDILDAIDRHSYACAHYGLNAQCNAITDEFDACDKAIDNIPEYYQGELSSHIDKIVGCLPND